MGSNLAPNKAVQFFLYRVAKKNWTFSGMCGVSQSFSLYPGSKLFHSESLIGTSEHLENKYINKNENHIHICSQGIYEFRNQI